MIEESVGPADAPPSEIDWRAIGHNNRRRIGLVRRLIAQDPLEKGIASTVALAERFGVTERTIWRDKAAVRAAAGERCENATEEVGVMLLQLDELIGGAIADIMLCPPNGTARASHRNSAATAMKLQSDILFRTGYLTEAARRVHLGGDSTAPPVRTLVETLGVERLAEIARNGSGGGDNGNGLALLEHIDELARVKTLDEQRELESDEDGEGHADP
jgi:hypothetical protein